MQSFGFVYFQGLGKQLLNKFMRNYFFMRK